MNLDKYKKKQYNFNRSFRLEQARTINLKILHFDKEKSFFMTNQHSEQDENHSPPNLEEVEHLAYFFKVFGDKTRLRILYLLSENEFCVTHMAESLDMSRPAISQQLRILKTNRLIKSRRDGKEVIYSLDDQHIHQILSQGMNHIHENFSL